MKKLKNSTKLVITENVNVLCKNKNIMIIDKDIEIYIYISIKYTRIYQLELGRKRVKKEKEM